MPRQPLFPLLRVGAVLAFGAALLYRPSPKPRPPAQPPPEGVWATDIDAAESGALRVGEKASGPLEGQKRPPCNHEVEREVAGACWIATEHRPPCPAGLYEAQSLCLVPVKAAKRPATSLQR